MNILFLCVIMIAAIFAYAGYRKGLFRSAVSTIGFVLAVFLTTLLYPYINVILTENTKIDDNIKSKIEKRFELNEEELTRNQEMDLLEKMELPQVVKDWIVENDNKETYLKYGAKNFNSYVSCFLTDLIMKGIAYIITYFVLMLLVYIIIALGDFVFNIPILKAINKTGGVIFGLAQALLFVWIAFVILTFISATEFGGNAMKMIEESVALSWIYKNNIILKFVVDIFGII